MNATADETVYEIVNSNGATVGRRSDLEAATRWANDYLTGNWSIRTVKNGECVIERAAADLVGR